MTCPACDGTGRIIWRYGGLSAKECPWCWSSGAIDNPDPKGSFFMSKTTQED